MSPVYPENLYNEYSSFYNNLIHLFPNNEFLESIKNEDKTQYIIRINKLITSLKSSDNFNNFAKSKIKVFSHKESDTTNISESLFGKNLTLKKIFNNQNESIKQLLWNQLHRLVIHELEEQNKNSPNKTITDKINKLKPISKVNDFTNPRQTFKKLIKTDELNTSTNNLINDIFSSFEDSMKGSNPLENLLNISTNISEKYKNQIDNGEINLDSLLGGLQNNLPGMDGIKNIIDPIIKMAGQQEEPKETVVIDENFSTANIDIGKQEETTQPMFANMLKTLDATGLMNMMKSSDNPENTEGLGKLLGVFNKMQSNEGNIDDILKNDLGLDMTQISEQMSKLMQQNQEP